MNYSASSTCLEVKIFRFAVKAAITKLDTTIEVNVNIVPAFNI